MGSPERAPSSPPPTAQVSSPSNSGVAYQQTPTSSTSLSSLNSPSLSQHVAYQQPHKPSTPHDEVSHHQRSFATNAAAIIVSQRHFPQPFSKTSATHSHPSVHSSNMSLTTSQPTRPSSLSQPLHPSPPLLSPPPSPDSDVFAPALSQIRQLSDNGLLYGHALLFPPLQGSDCLRDRNRSRDRMRSRRGAFSGPSAAYHEGKY